MKIPYYIDGKGKYITPCPYNDILRPRYLRMVGSIGCQGCTYFKKEHLKTVKCLYEGKGESEE